MKFDEELIDKLALKLMIGLSKEENQTVLNEFKLIDENMELINNIKDIDKFEPMTHPYDLYLSSLRDDKVEESISFKDALRNCDVVDGREIKVPKTVN